MKYLYFLIAVCLTFSSAAAQSPIETDKTSTPKASIFVTPLEQKENSYDKAESVRAVLNDSIVLYSDYQLRMKDADYILGGRLVKIDPFPPYALILDLQMTKKNDAAFAKQWIVAADLAEARTAKRYKDRSRTLNVFLKAVIDDFVMDELSTKRKSPRSSSEIFDKIKSFFKRSI